MDFLVELWFPVVLSAVFVFVVSSIFHMLIPIHKSDCRKLPNEGELLGAMRNQGLTPGQYVFPCPGTMKEMCSPEMIEKYKQGPVGIMTIMPGGSPRIGRSLILWFLYSILVGIFVAYVAKLGLTFGADPRAVFRVTGTVAVLAYAVSYIPDSIWKGHTWSSTLKYIFDGVVYGLVTAFVFAWLWPEAA